MGQIDYFASTDFGAGLLYIAHTLLEIVLGAVKLRGRYSAMQTPPGAERFVRHHGISLLALAMLGCLVLGKRMVHTEFGKVASATLAFFHAGAVMTMLHAWSQTGEGLNVAFTHAPFAIGFFLHGSYGSRPHREKGGFCVE